jgi:hypothetical protein
MTAYVPSTTGTNTTVTAGAQVPIIKGSSVQITMTVTETFVNSAQYTIKLMTAKGNTVTYAQTYGS